MEARTKEILAAVTDKYSDYKFMERRIFGINSFPIDTDDVLCAALKHYNIYLDLQIQHLKTTFGGH